LKSTERLSSRDRANQWHSGAESCRRNRR
jgi:hypothetical protein